jgi:hypothetical protein
MPARPNLTVVNAHLREIGCALRSARSANDEGVDSVLFFLRPYRNHGVGRSRGRPDRRRRSGVKRVPELVPLEIAEQSGFKLGQRAPIATVDELPLYDAIIFGSPTRFGSVTGQMRNFLD